MYATTTSLSLEQVTTDMCEQITKLTRTLATWMHDQPHTLADLEHHVVRLLKELGASLIAQLCTLAAHTDLPNTIACACGHLAHFERFRPAKVTTLLGPLSFSRPYYLCPACRHGQHPLDVQLQLCAGSQSAALEELLALLGATQNSFAQAAEILERLTLLHLAPNTIRQATEQFGATLVAEHSAEQTAEQSPSGARPQASRAQPKRLYITLDGVFVHLRQTGWSELKLGCCYQTLTRPNPRQSETIQIYAANACYTTTLAASQDFGWQLWQQAVQSGLLETNEVVVVADGAHWIWNIVEKHFPQAIQIVDWYHASAYVWSAASAIWGETGAGRTLWAEQQLERLWQGQVSDVVSELAQSVECGEGVRAALSYYTTHQRRMDYATYRAQGLQIGSGSAESGCKQVVSARLKQAGMRWSAAGAEAVAMLRAWLKSGRWDEAVALRPKRRRGYKRKQECGGQHTNQEQQQTHHKHDQNTKRQTSRGKTLENELLAQVQSELALQRGKNVWANRRYPAPKQQRSDQTGAPILTLPT